MDERKQVSELAIKNFSPEEASPFETLWYNIAEERIYRRLRKWLKNKINAKTLILNAGSGGIDYGIKDGTMVHLDIVDKLVNMHEKHLVASIDSIPCDDNSFDVVICVGSVLNYTDIILGIKELCRVLKPSGTLILEFERSNSAEFIFTKNRHQNVAFCDEKYGNQRHKYWVFDEKFVLYTLEHYGMNCKKKFRFHIVSSLILRITKSEKLAARFAFFDYCCQLFSYGLASNVIFCLKKGKATI
jgi:SAM-dependent methyltransferase